MSEKEKQATESTTALEDFTEDSNKNAYKVNVKKELEDEELFLYQVALFCSEIDHISINNLQIHFGLGFNRASRIIKELEDRGIVSEKQGLNGRKLLVAKEDLKKRFNISSKEPNSVALESTVASRKKVKGSIDELLGLEEVIQASKNDFVEELDPETKDLLIKYNLLDCILKSYGLPALINLDLSDYLELFKNGTIFAYCNETITKNELPKIIKLSEPKNKIAITLNVSYSDDLELSTIDYILKYFKEQFPSSSIIYGTSQDNDIEKGKIGILALFVSENN